ncbi:MAG TPA: transglutaminase family protein [Bryobacteraceae bacterium]|jgi:transglutaminase-like putative cysteine protease|nr:transglutaminase family protein [Bryobacteraceae bacterium]
MQIRLGYELIYSFPQPTPMILALNIHYSRASDLIIPDYLTTDPPIAIGGYRDLFGNWCTRALAPGGRIRIKTDALIRDSGLADNVFPDAGQHAVHDLPEESLVFLLGSRYCETDLLSQAAWDLFENVPAGWQRVQAICDYVHNRIAFDYQQARATRTAWEAFNERVGVCRDYAHLAVAFCRCMNIPARYCTGYLGDMGTPPPYGVGDFAAWFEVYIGGSWHIFDARNNVPRIGRVLLARGRDASDVAIATTFGPNTLESFKVWADEVVVDSPESTVL